MRYDRKKDRSIWREMNKASYDSRQDLAAKARVRAIVEKFAHQHPGLGEVDTPLLDRYYIRSHFPPKDVLTELAGAEEKKIPFLKIALIVGALYALKHFCL